MFDLSNYAFSPYALPVLAVGVAVACLGLVTVIRERGSPVSLAFCAMTWSIAIWLLSFGAIYSTVDRSVALQWVRVEHLGVAFIPSTVFYFTLAGVGRLREMRLFAWVSFALSGLFYLGVVSTDWFVVGVHHYFWGYYPIAGLPYVLFLAFFFGLMALSFRLYWVGQRRTASGIHQQQLKASMLALGVAYLASIDYLAAFNIPVYTAGYLFIAAFVVMVARAIWRYRLVDITLAFAANQITDTMADALLVLDREGVIRVANGAASELFGCAKEELIGRAAATIGTALFSDQQAEQLIEAGTPRYYDAAYERTEGDMRILGVSASVMRDRRGEPVATVCIAHDITDRKRAEALLAAEKQVLEMVAAGAPLPEVLDALARNVEAQSEGLLCAVLLLDRDGAHLREGSGPSLPESYRQAVDGIAIGPSAGSCGTAAYRRETVIVTDIATDPLWADYRDLALSHGLRACWSTPILSSGGEVLGTFAMYYRQPRAPDQRDLDLIERATHIACIAIERRRAEEALRDSEETYRELFENANDIVYTHDLTGRFTSINRAAEQVTGYSREEAANMNVAQIVAPEHLKQAMENTRRKVEEGGTTTYELEIIARDGRRIPLEVSTRLIYRDGNLVGVQGVARDITERKRAAEAIRHLAFHDSLTGLANRALLMDRLSMALAQARRSGEMLAVIFLDLDRFKVVNDSVGHAGGDRLLQSVAQELQGVLREGDTVARVGGDEFTLLLPAIARPEDAIQIAERILADLRRPQVLQGQEFLVTTSIGIAIYPDDGQDAETLLRNADIAMYRAKEQGRDNHQLFTPSMNARIVERLALENGLRRALERQEFVVHYQPKANIASGRIVGAEALVRWQHTGRGLVLPGEFIPLAEETGFIVPLGEWVLQTACAQNKAWQEAGLPPLRVSVNLSMRQFLQSDLVQMVARALHETGLAPRYLELEITESVASQQPDVAILVLRQLREMGVHISVDDFGTGYSSLNYLKRFPIHTLKIDRSFVNELTTDPNDVAIASAIITLAHSLNLDAIAEGVETEEQLAFLKQRQCDEFQGFLLARPMPAEALEKMLRREGPLLASSRARTAS